MPVTFTDLLTNIKSEHGTTRITLPSKLLIVGENGRGKSTISDAIDFIMTGRVNNVCGKDDVKDSTFLLSLAPEQEPDRIYAKAKLSDGTKLGRDVIRVDGTARRQDNSVPQLIASRFIRPLDLVDEAFTAGAKKRKEFLALLVESHLDEDDRARLREVAAEIGINLFEDALNSATDVQSTLTQRLAEIRGQIRSLKTELKVAQSRVDSMRTLNPSDEELAKVSEELDYYDNLRNAYSKPVRAATAALQDANFNVNSLKDTCVVCNQPVPDYHVKLTALVSTAQQAEQNLRDTHAEYDVLIETTNSKLLALSESLNELSERRRAYEGAVAWVKSLEFRINLEIQNAKTCAKRLTILMQVITGLVKKAKDSWLEDVNSHLPPGMQAGIQDSSGKDGFVLGLIKNDRLLTSQSEGQKVMLRVAVAMTYPLRENSVAVICLPDVDFGPKTMAAAMQAWSTWPGQILFGQTKEPAYLPDGWTIHRLDD